MNNTYGTVKPSVIDVAKDVEIWWQYKPTRSTTETEYSKYSKLSSEETQNMFRSAEVNNIEDNGKTELLPGMFELSLPASIFGNVGFYTLYIKPKEIICTIQDVGALTAYPETRGIVINMNNIDNDNRSLFQSDNLTGYRVEYFGMDESTTGKFKRLDYYRLVTSCAYCEPVSQNMTNANTNSNGYRYNDSGSLAFLTLSPNLAPSFRGSTQKPYIGTPTQQIAITNTKFDPVCIEIEICKNDFDTITTVLTGNQIRSLDNGILTTYNENGEIFNQYEFYTVKDTYTKTDVYDVKKNRVGNIDTSANYVEIINQ